MKLKNFGPAVLDKWAQNRSGLPASAWRFARMVLIDRALYWGLAVTVVLPAVFSLFGGGFAFHGGVATAVAFSFALWVYLLVSSVVVGIPTAALLPASVARNVQRVSFLGTSGLGLWAFAHWLPSVLVLSTAGLIAGVALITALGEWSIGGGACADGACELPKK
jgi:hypothetical protein